MSEETNAGGFFPEWFKDLDKGLENLETEHCACLFSECAKMCASNVVQYFYRDIFDACEGNLDKFFTKLNEIDNVEGKIIKPGKAYELILGKCECPIHTDAGITSNHLCACSKESLSHVFKELVPHRPFQIEQLSTILGGSSVCRHRITFEG